MDWQLYFSIMNLGLLLHQSNQRIEADVRAIDISMEQAEEWHGYWHSIGVYVSIVLCFLPLNLNFLNLNSSILLLQLL